MKAIHQNANCFILSNSFSRSDWQILFNLSQFFIKYFEYFLEFSTLVNGYCRKDSGDTIHYYKSVSLS